MLCLSIFLSASRRTTVVVSACFQSFTRDRLVESRLIMFDNVQKSHSFIGYLAMFDGYIADVLCSLDKTIPSHHH